MEPILLVVAAGLAFMVYGYHKSGPAPAIVKCPRCKSEHVSFTGASEPAGVCYVCEFRDIVNRGRP